MARKSTKLESSPPLEEKVNVNIKDKPQVLSFADLVPKAVKENKNIDLGKFTEKDYKAGIKKIQEAYKENNLPDKAFDVCKFGDVKKYGLEGLLYVFTVDRQNKCIYYFPSINSLVDKYERTKTETE